MSISKTQIDGFVREIHISSNDLIYDVVVTPDAPGVEDFIVKLPADEARALIGLVGKECRVIVTPKIVAR